MKALQLVRSFVGPLIYHLALADDHQRWNGSDVVVHGQFTVLIDIHAG